MAQPDRAALINYLTRSVQSLHVEDQRLKLMLLRIKQSQQIGVDDFEAMIDAQQAALRIPANALLMLAGLLESNPDVAVGGPPPAPAPSTAPSGSGGAPPRPPGLCLPGESFKLKLKRLLRRQP